MGWLPASWTTSSRANGRYGSLRPDRPSRWRRQEPVLHPGPVEAEQLGLVREPQDEALVHQDAVAELAVHQPVQPVPQVQGHGERDDHVGQAVVQARSGGRRSPSSPRPPRTARSRPSAWSNTSRKTRGRHGWAGTDTRSHGRREQVGEQLHRLELGERAVGPVGRPELAGEVVEVGPAPEPVQHPLAGPDPGLVPVREQVRGRTRGAYRWVGSVRSARNRSQT